MARKDRFVRLHLPNRIVYTLRDIELDWRVKETDIQHWLMQGDLSAHVWMPTMSVYQIQEAIEGANIRLADKLRHWKGYARMTRYHCQRLFQHDRLTLREFFCENGDEHFVLPEEVEDIDVGLDRVVIWRNGL